MTHAAAVNAIATMTDAQLRAAGRQYVEEVAAAFYLSDAQAAGNFVNAVFGEAAVLGPEPYDIVRGEH